MKSFHLFHLYNFAVVCVCPLPIHHRGCHVIYLLLTSAHHSHLGRPPRRGLCGAAGGAAGGGRDPRSTADPAEGVPSHRVSDSGAEAPLDPALHTEPKGRPDQLQKVRGGGGVVFCPSWQTL